MCNTRRRDSMSVMRIAVLDAVNWNVLYLEDSYCNTFVCSYIVQCNSPSELGTNVDWQTSTQM